jgi:hypothetical protein
VVVSAVNLAIVLVSTATFLFSMGMLYAHIRSAWEYLGRGWRVAALAITVLPSVAMLWVWVETARWFL